MAKETLKKLEIRQKDLNQAFEKLDSQKRKLADFEQETMHQYGQIYYPLRQLEYEIRNLSDALDLSENMANLQSFEGQLAKAFDEGREGLKEREWRLDEKADHLAKAKIRYYQEEEDGN
ncbi:hypothetical protein [Streptococcus oricebi]|uniref:Uncharacterized protein n=1 Tax=Streptococcus oricebi TaxID=1547447 RepID=A0ABS5B3U3_9STRE|nr:hypothetical protein [Streptococcus oricebi]MBP2623503.1 hypothetical protein [Streptococcus oricebi]